MPAPKNDSQTLTVIPLQNGIRSQAHYWIPAPDYNLPGQAFGKTKRVYRVTGLSGSSSGLIRRAGKCTVRSLVMRSMPASIPCS